MKTLTLSILAIVFCICLARAQDGNVVDLSKRLAADSKVLYTWSSKAWQKTTGKDPNKPTIKSGETQIRLSVAALAPAPTGESRYRLRFEQFKMRVDTPMGPMEYDSSAPASGATSRPGAAAGLETALRPLVGLDIDVVVDAAGTVTATSGAEELVGGKGPTAMFANQFLDAISVNRKFGCIFSCLGSRDGAAKLGQTLKKDEKIVPMPELPPLVLTRELKLTETSGKLVKFELSGAGVVQPDPKTEKQGMKIEKADARLTGAGAWHAHDGVGQTYDEEQNIDLQLLVMELPVRVESKITLKLARVE